MENSKIVNIVNFVRGVEPRKDLDLFLPVAEELRIAKEYGFDTTFLLQYDAMCRSDFADFFTREKDESVELGVWLELCRPLVESIGAKWNGRWDWDWHVNPGFLNAYPMEQKAKMLDIIMEKFSELFGEYPRSAGCWILDSDVTAYLHDKYGVETFCICREQWGTDGYTLWGGYYNGAYYPSKKSLIHPAQTADGQIQVPVFRMLGPDPIYCYCEKHEDVQKELGMDLFTLEPCWGCGKREEWVDWYYRNLLNNEDMGYSYTQTGQENSFGWHTIGEGYKMQLARLDILRNEGKVTVEKLCDSGQRFLKNYSLTPSNVYSALDDWSGNGRQSVWYCCKNYRVNFYRDGENILLRDLYIFDELCVDSYMKEPCKEPSAQFRTVKVVDSLINSTPDVKSGLYLGKGKITSTERNGDTFILSVLLENAEMKIYVTEGYISFSKEQDFTVIPEWGSSINQHHIIFDKDEEKPDGIKDYVEITEGKAEKETYVSKNGTLTFKIFNSSIR